MSQEELKDRIKKIRKYYGLTQVEFAKRLGTVQNTITGYETGHRNPSGSAQQLICKEFGINEVWLRTGEGGDANMLSQISDNDRLSLSLGKLSISDNKFIQNALITLAETEPEKLKVIEDFMKKCLGLD